MSGDPITVLEESTIYWIHKRTGLISTYNWDTMKFASGSIVGIEHESFIAHFCRDNTLSINFHLSIWKGPCLACCSLNMMKNQMRPIFIF